MCRPTSEEGCLVSSWTPHAKPGVVEDVHPLAVHYELVLDFSLVLLFEEEQVGE